MSTDPRTQVILEGNVEAFFYGMVGDAVHNQGVEATDEACHYLVKLLTHYSQTDRLFARTTAGLALQPLANLYTEAVTTTSTEARNQALRRLGDVALFISGVFPDSLGRKLVDVDYYIAMGGTAYSYLSEVAEQSERWHALGEIFDELAVKFSLFVGVLGEVTEQAHFAQNRDLLRLYETWLRTGSSRLFQRLQALGIHPVRAGSGQVRN